MTNQEFRKHVQQIFPIAIGKPQDGKRISILCHSDADGLTAGAILFRTLSESNYDARIFATGKGETPWSAAIQKTLYAQKPDLIILADLSPRATQVLPDTQTIWIDHHHPEGIPENSILITGYGLIPTPSSGLIAFWCCAGLADIDRLTWMAAVSLVSDMCESPEFEELQRAFDLHGPSTIRKLVSLLNAPRRTAKGDPTPALDSLLKAKDPGEILRGDFPELAALQAAKREVHRELQEAKKAAPKFSGKVAFIRVHSSCQVHPLIAQIWRTRLKSYIVFAINTGFRPGFVHFSVRTSDAKTNLIDFLREHAPQGIDEGYGGGHDGATGGALPYAVWNRFASSLGFGVEMQVQEIMA